MKFMRSEYEYVVVDTPPVLAVADATVLANMTDSVVMVSKYRSTTKHEIMDAQFKIHQMSSKRVHGIINFATDRDEVVTYYPYVMPGKAGEMSLFDNKKGDHSQKDDLKKFEEQLRRRKAG